jgi:hypothetical protein
MLFEFKQLDFDKFLQYLVLTEDKTNYQIGKAISSKRYSMGRRLAIWEDPDQHRADPKISIPLP